MQPYETHLVALLFAAANAELGELHRRLADEGFADLRPGHGGVFGNVAAKGSRPTELARLAGLSKQTVGEIARDLERLGYLERAPDPSDRRATILRLTERGRQGRAAGDRILADLRAELCERFGARRIRDLEELLAGMARGDA